VTASETGFGVQVKVMALPEATAEGVAGVLGGMMIWTLLLYP
jgi:hypothetical protein